MNNAKTLAEAVTEGFSDNNDAGVLEGALVFEQSLDEAVAIPAKETPVDEGETDKTKVKEGALEDEKQL